MSPKKINRTETFNTVLKYVGTKLKKENVGFLQEEIDFCQFGEQVFDEAGNFKYLGVITNKKQATCKQKAIKEKVN